VVKVLDDILSFEWLNGYSIKTTATDTLSLGVWQYIRVLVEGDHNVLNPAMKDILDPYLSLFTWLAGIAFIIIRVGFQWSKWKSIKLDNKGKELDMKLKEKSFELTSKESTTLMNDISLTRILQQSYPDIAEDIIEKQTKIVQEEQDKNISNGN
jgi:hypothetical protein